MYKFEVGKVYRSCDDDDYLYRYEGLCKDYEGNEAYQFGIIKNDKYKEPIYGVCVRADHIFKFECGTTYSETVCVNDYIFILAKNIVED